MSDITTGAQVGIGADGAVGANVSAELGLRMHNVYRAVCRGPVKGADGRWRRKCKWVEQVPNLTTVQGLNNILTNQFKASGYTAAWYVGLVNNAGFTAFDAADTAAQIGGTNQWAEATAYSESVRQTLTLGTAAAGSISNTASKAVFTANGTVSIKGIFVVSVATKSDTTGVLYGEAAFSNVRDLFSTDTLTVTVTLTAATA